MYQSQICNQNIKTQNYTNFIQDSILRNQTLHVNMSCLKSLPLTGYLTKNVVHNIFFVELFIAQDLH